MRRITRERRRGEFGAMKGKLGQNGGKVDDETQVRCSGQFTEPVYDHTGQWSLVLISGREKKRKERVNDEREEKNKKESENAKRGGSPTLFGSSFLCGRAPEEKKKVVSHPLIEPSNFTLRIVLPSFSSNYFILLLFCCKSRIFIFGFGNSAIWITVTGEKSAKSLK